MMAALGLGTVSFAQTCDTIGGNAPGCGTRKSGQTAAQPVNPQNALRGRNDIRFTPDMSGLVGRTSQEDDQPKASIGGLTTDSDGRQCLQIGLSISCTKGPAR
jgi:hypothetical protein